jgi:hypothetical protein
VSARCGTSWDAQPRGDAEALRRDLQGAVQSDLWGYLVVSFESIRLAAKQDFHAGSTSHGCTGSTLGGGHFTLFG